MKLISGEQIDQTATSRQPRCFRRSQQEGPAAEQPGPAAGDIEAAPLTAGVFDPRPTSVGSPAGTLADAEGTGRQEGVEASWVSPDVSLHEFVDYEQSVQILFFASTRVICFSWY